MRSGQGRWKKGGTESALGCEYQICVLCPVEIMLHAICRLHPSACVMLLQRVMFEGPTVECPGHVWGGGRASWGLPTPESVANNSKPGANLKQLTGTPPVHSRFTGKVFISNPSFTQRCCAGLKVDKPHPS